MPEVKAAPDTMDARKPSSPPARQPLDPRLTEQRNPRSMRIDQLS
jgi:N-acetylmuramic acid 6-phosphate etherase